MKSQGSIPVTYLLLTDLLTGKVVRLLPRFLGSKLEREFMELPTRKETEREGASIVVMSQASAC